MNGLIKAVGGKGRIANKFIIPKILPHRSWYDATYFGGSTTLKKKPSNVEVACDANINIIRFNKLVQSKATALAGLVSTIPYEKAQFDWAEDWSNETDDLRFAAKYLIRSRFSRDGMMSSFVDSQRKRGNRPENQNVWFKMPESIMRYHNRIKNINFWNAVVGDLLPHVQYESDSCTYIDLPYLMGERRSKNLYQIEADEAIHQDMLNKAINCRGQVLISHYDHPMYNTMLKSWSRYELPVKINMGVGDKNGRVEILWSNR